MQPVIGVSGATARVDVGHGPEHHHLVPTAYLRSVELAGGLAVVLPVGHPGGVAALLDRVDGLVVTAGDEDVDPASYGAEPEPATATVDATRDAFDIALVRAAVDRNLPTLAICRGAQVLNVALGGSLHQQVEGHVGPRPGESAHPVAVEPDSQLAQLLGATDLEVNSLHHQAMERLGTSVQVVARAPDGTVEAIEVAGAHRVVGVQWHPELLRRRAEHLALFSNVVRMAAGA